MAVSSPVGSPEAVLQTRMPVRGRTYLVALPLLVATCLLSVYADMVSKVVQFGVLQFAPPAIAMLFFVVLANRGLKKLLGREFLNRAELIIVYAMLLTGVLVSTRGLVEKLVPTLAYLPYYSTPANNLGTTVSRHLPAWAVPFVPGTPSTDMSDAMRDYWDGNGGVVPWSTWVGPLCAWLVLISCVILVFLCLATLLRRQWMDNEQLRFPLTTLPLAMVTDETEGQPFFSNRLMWAGTAFSFLIFGINGLAANFPEVPKMVTDFNIMPFFSERPLNAIDYTPLYISLAAIGFAFFLPLDLLFSFWFFYWLTRAQDVAAISFGGLPTGIGTHNARIWTGFQAAGAYLVLVAAYVRIGWPYFKAAAQSALGRGPHVDDSNEMMPYRAAFTGLFLGFSGIILWLWLAGMHPLLAMAQMGLYLFLLAVIMSRGVAEGGLLMTETSFLPSHLIGLVYPLPALGPTNLSMLGMTNLMFARDMRGILLSAFLDGQKMAREVGLGPRRLLAPLLLAVVVGTASALVFFLHFNYRDGALALYGYPGWNSGVMFKSTASIINGTPLPNDATAWGGLGVGVVVTTLIVWARTRFSWIPFHPLGYALAPTWTMNCFWFPFLVAWMIKSLIMRFGGVDTYRKVAPFMLGLILGEFSAAVFWSLGNMARGWNVPSTLR